MRGAARVIGERILWSVRQLVDGRYVPAKELERYDAITSSFLGLRASRIAVYACGAIAIASLAASPFSGEESLAGYWEHFVGLAAFRFLLLHGLWRWVLWALFLARVSQLDLALQPTHPDLAGGLGFLCLPSEGFGFFVFAVATVVSAQTATEVALTGARVVGLQNQLATFAALMALLALIPLVPFSTRLIRLRESGLRDYGALAQRYCADFSRWVPARAPWKDPSKPSELAAQEAGPAPPSHEIQGLADLGTSFGAIVRIRPFIFEPKLPAAIAVAAFLPAVPVLLTQVPVETIVKPLLKVL
jgi:hypothetical protein